MANSQNSLSLFPRITTRRVISSLSLFLLALITILSGDVKADMLVFWNFDEDSSATYVTDSVHSERLNLVNSSIVDGKLSANGGYAQGTVNGTNGVNVTLPLGQSENPNYTMSAFLATTHNVYQGVGIMAWGTNSNYHCNCFRTLGGTSGKKQEGIGLNSYWWGADINKNGYSEVYSGLENHVATTGDATHHYLYLNGQLIISGETHGREEANQNFTVGNTVNNEKLYGTIDNAAVYNEILQHSDIITISASKVNGLTNWWKSGTTVDRIRGDVKPETVTGTTVITGANGDVMVFNRALETNEQAYYEGRLSTDHAFVIDNMAGSVSTKTTWIQGSPANMSDMTTVPLGIYVGGMPTDVTLTATADQLNSVNRTLVIGGGTLAIAADSDVSIDKNRVGFDSGSISTSGTGTITINSSEDLSFKAVNIGNSALNLNSSGDMRIIGSITGSGNLTKSGSGDLALATASCRSYTGALTVTDGTLTFCVQDVFGTADAMPKNSIVIDNATITNNAPYFNNLLNTTFKNGAKIVAANGQAAWKAFMLTGTTAIAFSGEGSTAENPVVFEVASTATGDARTNATICPYGTTFDVSDITKSDDADLIVSAVLANTNGTGKIGSFTKTGAGTMELTAANTYTGKTTVSAGVLKLTDAAVVAKGVIEIGENGTLEYNVSSCETALVFTTTAYVSGTGDIFKTGEGRLKINTDAIDIDTEDLIDCSVDNFVVTSGRLDYRGCFKGQLEVQSDATFSPGNSIGTTNIDGDFTLNSGAALLMEIGSTEAEGNDQLIVNGTTLYQDNSIIQFVLASDSTYTPSLGDEIEVTMPEIGDGSNVEFSSYFFTVKGYRGGNIILGANPNAVPEPSTWALLILGAVVLFLRKRVRN